MDKSGRCVYSHKRPSFLYVRSIQNPFILNFAAQSVLLLSVVILCQGMMGSLFECMCVLVLGLCMFICLSLCVTICAYVCMHVYMDMYLRVYVCLYVYMHVSVCMHMSLCLCMHVWIYQYACASICVYFSPGDGIHHLPNARQMLYLWATYTVTELPNKHYFISS